MKKQSIKGDALTSKTAIYFSIFEYNYDYAPNLRKYSAVARRDELD